MNGLLKFAAVLLLGFVPGWCDQTKEPAKPPVKAPNPNIKPVLPKSPGVKGGGAKIPAKSITPAFRPVPGPQIQRFLRLTPQERDIAIDKMPLPQQEGLRKRLAAFDALPAPERERQLRLWEAFSKLPKEQQDLLNQRIGEWQKLGPDRRPAVQRAYQLLSGKPEDERRAIIDSQEFKDRFTPTEQQIIVDLARYYPNPQM